MIELFSDWEPTRLRAHRILIENYSTDPDIVPFIISTIRSNLENLSGINNAWVLLDAIGQSALEPHVVEIQRVAADIGTGGPKIESHKSRVLQRLPLRY